MGLGRVLNFSFAFPVASLIKHRVVLVFLYFSSKKVLVLRWKEADDGRVLKSCGAYNSNFHSNVEIQPLSPYMKHGMKIALSVGTTTKSTINQLFLKTK